MVGQAQTSLRHLASMEGPQRGRNLMRLGLSESVPVNQPSMAEAHGGTRGASYESGAAEEAMGWTRTGLDTGYDKPA
jgi:hypothetical protein